MDANGRTGFLPTLGGLSLPPEIDAVGPYSPMITNFNGELIRQLCNEHGLMLANTHYEGAAGPTWFGSGTLRSRVDYVAFPIASRSMTSCRLWQYSGFQLQLSKAPRQYDHMPVVLDFRYRSWHEAPTRNYQRIDVQGLATALQTGSVQHLCLDIDDALRDDHVQQQLSTAFIENDVNEYWATLNDQVHRATLQLFPKKPENWSRPQRQDESVNAAHELYAQRARTFALLHHAAQQSAQRPLLLNCILLWRAWAVCMRLSRRVQALRRREARELRRWRIQQLRNAIYQQDARRVWQWARVIAGAGSCFKNRQCGRLFCLCSAAV